MITDKIIYIFFISISLLILVIMTSKTPKSFIKKNEDKIYIDREKIRLQRFYNLG